MGISFTLLDYISILMIKNIHPEKIIHSLTPSNKRLKLKISASGRFNRVFPVMTGSNAPIGIKCWRNLKTILIHDIKHPCNTLREDIMCGRNFYGIYFPNFALLIPQINQIIVHAQNLIQHIFLFFTSEEN